MNAHISIVTLGVDDLARARAFYEKGLGYSVSSASVGDVVFMRAGGAVLALYPRAMLAEDAALPAGRSEGFCGITLAQNVATKELVAPTLARAAAAGARILKPAQDVFWGGHHGYFADPDGHVWEVAWNPGFPLEADGRVNLPR